MAYTGKVLRETIMEKYREALSMKEKLQPAGVKTPGYLASLLESEFLNVPGVSEELEKYNLQFHRVIGISQDCVFIFTPIQGKPPYCLFPTMYPYILSYTVARVVEDRSLPYSLDFDKEFLQSDILDWVKQVCNTACGNIRKLLRLVQNVEDFMESRGLTAEDIHAFKRLEIGIRNLCVSNGELLCTDVSSQDFEKSVYNKDYRSGMIQNAVRMGILGESPASKENIGSLPISALQLTFRSENCLHRNNIHTVGDLLRTRISDLQEFRGLGKSTLENILDALSLQGLKLQP